MSWGQKRGLNLFHLVQLFVSDAVLYIVKLLSMLVNIAMQKQSTVFAYEGIWNTECIIDSVKDKMYHSLLRLQTKDVNKMF